MEDISKEARVEIESSEQKSEKRIINKQVEIGKKNYEVIIEKIASKSRNKKKKQDNMLVMYFIDDTKYKNILKKFEESKTCMGIVMIDSYDDLTQSLTQEEKTQITTEIETKIYEWASKIGGIALKSDRDRFVVVFEQKYLDKIIEDKFEILKEIKNIETEGIIPVTLSIAISAEGETNSDKFKLAIEAMDLVLGRRWRSSRC